MTPTTLVLIAIIGGWFFQDALASIAYYPNEKWKWNHIARIVRAGMGLTLVLLVIGAIG